MNRVHLLMVALLVGDLCACAPAFNWREFVPEGSRVVATFPCRPDRHARLVTVAQARVRMEMVVCAAGGSTFALAFLDVADPGRVMATLDDLQAIALANVQSDQPQRAPTQVRGMTANSQSVRLSAQGRLPGGDAVQVHAAFFAKGLRVYQATVVGAAPAPQVVEIFLGGLKFPA
jgi:hypothetical protein